MIHMYVHERWTNTPIQDTVTTNIHMHILSNLNILEVHISILAEVDNGSKEIEQSFKAFERLKQLDESIGGELLVVL